MEKFYVGKLSDIDVLGARKVFVGGLELALFRLSDGSVSAMENRCPHKNGKLSEGMVCGQVVHCPLHDWRIDTKSGSVLEPDHGCVPTYQTEVNPATGDIFVLIQKERVWEDGIRQTG